MIILFAVFFAYHLIKYRNPYKLIMVIGKKGSGKTTLMVKLSLKSVSYTHLDVYKRQE